MALERGVRTALDLSMAIVELSPQGKIIDANNYFCQLMGYSIEELRQQSHTTLCDRDYAASAEYRVFWQHLQSGEFYRGRVSRRNRNGNTIWLEATYNPIRDNQGNVERVIKFARDITDKIEAMSGSYPRPDNSH